MNKTSLASIICALAALLAGCDTTSSTQLTSGRSYLERSHSAATEAGNVSVDDEILAAAAVEPSLRFPARVGMVRLEHGTISDLPIEERFAWEGVAERLGPEFGEFVMISPLVADLVAPVGGGGESDVIRRIRLASARQHLDAVLVYEVYSSVHRESEASSIAAWTIVGAYVVPSEDTQVVSVANALLLDVRNGYPYGSASASFSAKKHFAMVNARGKGLALQAESETAAALNLVPKIESLVRALAKELPVEDIAAMD